MGGFFLSSRFWQKKRTASEAVPTNYKLQPATSNQKLTTSSILVVHRENLVGGIFVWIHVHHPAENHWAELSSRRVAGVLRGDRSVQAKLCVIRGLSLLPRWHAQIRVHGPGGHAQPRAFV